MRQRLSASTTFCLHPPGHALPGGGIRVPALAPAPGGLGPDFGALVDVPLGVHATEIRFRAAGAIMDHGQTDLGPGFVEHPCQATTDDEVATTVASALGLVLHYDVDRVQVLVLARDRRLEQDRACVVVDRVFGVARQRTGLEDLVVVEPARVSRVIRSLFSKIRSPERRYKAEVPSPRISSRTKAFSVSAPNAINSKSSPTYSVRTAARSA